LLFHTRAPIGLVKYSLSTSQVPVPRGLDRSIIRLDHFEESADRAGPGLQEPGGRFELFLGHSESQHAGLGELMGAGDVRRAIIDAALEVIIHGVERS
jgi:hypothetical protein